MEFLQKNTPPFFKCILNKYLYYESKSKSINCLTNFYDVLTNKLNNVMKYKI